MAKQLSQSQLKALLNYEPDTGVFTWRINRCGMKSGDVAGRAHHHGHIQIGVLGKRYQAHRLAWLWMTGNWPDDQIDHINHVRSDNRWINLRHANNSENAYNRTMRSDNTSGARGVVRFRNKWRVQVQVNGVRHNFGFYSDFELAELVAMEARAKYHGEFAS